jgi:hypothetical protein
MAFGQPSGPPASGKQLQELLSLLHAAGHVDFRDARGPMGFTQRQAGGKFTRDEADSFIAQLQEWAEIAENAGATPEPVPTLRRASSPKVTAAERSLKSVPSEVLAAELQQRGWVVLEP